MNGEKDDDKKVDPTQPPKPETLPTKPKRENDGTTAPDFQDGMKEDGSTST